MQNIFVKNFVIILSILINNYKIFAAAKIRFFFELQIMNCRANALKF